MLYKASASHTQFIMRLLIPLQIRMALCKCLCNFQWKFALYQFIISFSYIEKIVSWYVSLSITTSNINFYEKIIPYKHLQCPLHSFSLSISLFCLRGMWAISTSHDPLVFLWKNILSDVWWKLACKKSVEKTVKANTQLRIVCHETIQKVNQILKWKTLE